MWRARLGGLQQTAASLAAIRARPVLRAVADIVAPPMLLEGGRREPALSPGLSAEAWSRIRFIEAPVCDGCGAPQPYDAGDDARCADCVSRSRAYDRARAAVVYDEASRELVLRLKRADRTDLAGLFALWLLRAARDLVREADAVTPVPLHPLRLISRRFNQAAEIARPFARHAGLGYLPDVLVRRRPTPSQAGRSGAARRQNMAGAFAVPRRAWSAIEGRRLILVDDVLTTGATAEACARALKAAGAAGVDVAAVARVQAPEPEPI